MVTEKARASFVVCQVEVCTILGRQIEGDFSNRLDRADKRQIGFPMDRASKREISFPAAGSNYRKRKVNNIARQSGPKKKFSNRKVKE